MARWLRVARRVFTWLLLGSLLLTAAVAGAIQLPAVRLFVRDKILGAIQGSLKGTIELADVRWPMPQQLELSGLLLRDRHGTRVAGLTSMLAHVRYRSLLSGQLELERLELSGAYVDLADLSDEHGLLSLFASSETKPPKPPVPAADSGMSPLPIVVRELCIEHGELRLAPDPEQRFALRRLNGCVRLRVAQHLQVAIEALEAQLLRNEAQVAQLAHPDQLGPLASHAAPGQPMRVSLTGQLAVGKDMPFDARLRVRNFSGSSLAALGVSGDVLRGSVDLDLHAAQSRGRLAYRAQLESAAGAVLMHGELDAQRRLWLQLETGSLALAKLTTLPLAPLGVALDAQLGLATPGKQELRLHVTRGYYGAWPLPELSAEAVREENGRVILNGLEAKQAHAELTGRGQLQPDGAVTAALRLSVPELSELAPLQDAGVLGGVNAELSLERAADARLDARVELRAHQLRSATQRAEDITLKARVTGQLERPVVQLDVKGDQLMIAGRSVGEAILALGGGPDRYELTLDADQHVLRLEGWAEPRAGGWNGGLQLKAALDQGPVELQLPLARFVPGECVELLKPLHAVFQKSSLFADGKLDLRGSTSLLRLQAQVPDVAMLSQALGQNPVPGRAELAGVVRGQLARPVLELRLSYRDGIKVAGAASALALELHADASKGRSQLELQASAGAAHVTGKLASRWGQRLPLSAAAKQARHELALELRSVSLAELLDPGSPEPRRLFDGNLSGNITARGNLSKLELATRLTSRVRMARDPGSVDLVVDASYKDAQLKLAVDGGDRRGQLLQLHASTQLALEQQLAAPRPWLELVQASAWELSTELAERPLRELPMLASADLADDLAPARLALHANLGHEPHSEPSGIFEAQLRWAPQGLVRAASTSCNQRARGQLLLSGKWAEQKLGVELHGGPQTDEAIRASARMHAAFADALAGQLRSLSGVQLLLQLHKLDLASMPFLCEQGAGSVSLTAKARDLMTPSAEVSLQTETHGLRWGEIPPLDVALETHSVPEGLRVSGQIETGGGRMHLQGQVPVDVRARAPSQMVQANAPVQLDMQLARLPMAALLGFVPAVARVSGSTSGQVQVRGSVNKPDASGKLSFDDVSLTLPRLGQRFSHLHLKAELDDNTLRLSEGKVRDLNGTATLAALLTLKSRDAWHAELNLNARNFPLRKSGVMLGHTDADARVVAESTPERTNVEVGLKNVSVDLTSDEIGDVQSLDPNPEFSFVDSRLTAAPAEQPADPNARSTPAFIHIVTNEPLWVRRDDFAVQMSTDLNITLGGKTPVLQGKIELLRGYINLLGQSFDIKRGRVVLAGGDSVDPQLEITAEHDTPGGTRVRVEVKGFVRAPELTFFVNDQTTTAGEALIAISGRNDHSGSAGSPEQQIASAAIGMTTGLLSLGARREFGDWIPMLSIEQGAQTRVRVGIEADRFIPNILRGFVRGAYVEGIVASGSSGSSASDAAAAAQGGTSGGGVVAGGQSGGAASTASGTGVLLELMLPKNFVWAGQYGPGQAWSIDLDWRP